MIAPNRIYVVTYDTNIRLIRAPNANSAARFAAHGLLEVKVATQDVLVELIAAGVKVENSAAAPGTAEAP